MSTGFDIAAKFAAQEAHAISAPTLVSTTTKSTTATSRWHLGQLALAIAITYREQGEGFGEGSQPLGDGQEALAVDQFGFGAE